MGWNRAGAVILLLSTGCGARTGLLVPDAEPPPDAFADVTTDGLVDSGFDTVTDVGLIDAPLPPPTLTFDVPFELPPTPPKGTIATGLATIKQVDVAIVVDTTGSMSGSIDNLRTNLKSSVIPGIAAAIPSVGLAVVDHKDYPITPHGSDGDFPALVRQTVTPDVAKAQAALDGLVASGGGDGPEAQIPAMWHTLVGGELRWSGGVLPKHFPPAGTVGGVDFRPGSLRIVVLVTDVDWHDCDYAPGVLSPPCFSTLSKAFVENNARFVDLTTSFGTELQADRLSDETGSSIPPSAFGTACGGACCTGVSGAPRPPTGPGGRCRLNFLHEGGKGVSDSIVRAIQAISIGSTFDVIAQVFDDPSDAVDATKFVKKVRAMDEGDALKGCAAHAAKDTDGDGVKDLFVAVPTGTRVCFEVTPQMNTSVKPTAEDQYFQAVLQIMGLPGLVRLDTQTLRFRVPKIGSVDAGP